MPPVDDNVTTSKPSIPVVHKGDFAVGSYEWIRSQVYGWSWSGAWPWIEAVFSDIMYISFDNVLWAYEYEIVDDELVLGEAQEARIEYVIKAMQEREDQIEANPVLKSEAADRGELSGLVVAKNEAEQIVTGIVLVPGESDTDGDVLTADVVTRVAHNYLLGARYLDQEHDFNVVDAAPVESHVLKEAVDYGDFTAPAGSWEMSVKVFDADTWEKVVDGSYKGFSIAAFNVSDMDLVAEGMGVDFSYKSLEESGAIKRRNLSDLDDDWFVATVSLVERPAVSKALYTALKSEAKPKPGVLKSFADKVFGARGSTKEGRRLSDNSIRQIINAQQAIQAGNIVDAQAALEELLGSEVERSDTAGEDVLENMDENKLTAIFKSTAEEVVEPIIARLEALEAQGAADPEPEAVETEEVTAGDDTVVSESPSDSEQESTDGVDVEALQAENASMKARIESYEHAVPALKTQVRGNSLDGQEGSNTEGIDINDTAWIAATKADNRDEHGRRIADSAVAD